MNTNSDHEVVRAGILKAASVEQKEFQEELLTLRQFLYEYPSFGGNICLDIDEGKLRVSMIGHRIFVTRSNADHWLNEQSARLMKDADTERLSILRVRSDKKKGA